MLSQIEISRRFTALSDPTRRAIIDQLATGDASVTELAAPFSLSQPTITSHLNVLEQAGLISRRKAAQKRICTLNAQALEPIEHWLTQVGQQWASRMDRLTAYTNATSTDSGD